MASIYLHSSNKSPYWVAVFSDETGKQRHRSTKTKNREQALAIAERYQRMAKSIREAKEKRGETAVPGAELILEELIVAAQKAIAGRLSGAEARGCLDRILKVSGQDASLSLSVKKYLEDWLAARRKSVEDVTADSYDEKVHSFLSYLEKKGIETMDAVRKEHVEAYRSELVASGIATTTVNLKIKMASTPFLEAHSLGHISPNPFAAIRSLPAMHAQKEAFTLEQLRALLRQADEEWKGMILVGASTGSRIGDVAAIRWGNVDLEKGTIVFLPDKKLRRVTTKKQESIILPDLHDYLAALPGGRGGANPDSPVFPILSKKSVRGHTGLSLTFRALMEAAGIKSEATRTPKKGSRGRQVFSLGFHSLRHSCTSLMANAGVSKEIRKRLVGHTSDVHDTYTHFERKTLQKALAKFPKLLARPDKSGKRKLGRKS